jgi:hypothetical protein
MILWSSIMQKPIIWAEVGYRIRSFTIVKECLIHIVGQWHAFPTDAKRSIITPLQRICEAKYKELVKHKKTMEFSLSQYTPSNLQRVHKTHATVKEIGRTSYGNDIVDWMVLCLWRQWFARGLVEDFGHHGPDGGYLMYRVIQSGGEAFLNKSEVDQFHQKHQMTTRGVSKFAERLSWLKDKLQKIIAPLMTSELNLDLSRISDKPQYLLCTQITKAEIEDVWRGDESQFSWQVPVAHRSNEPWRARSPENRRKDRHRKHRSSDDDLFYTHRSPKVSTLVRNSHGSRITNV